MSRGLPDEMTAEEYLAYLRENGEAGQVEEYRPDADVVRRNTRNSKVGSNGETIAMRKLADLGVRKVRKVGKAVRLNPYRDRNGRRPTKHGRPLPVYYVIFDERLPGDLTGMYGLNARMVLAEVKTVDGDRLQYSKLRDGQPENLQAHHDEGGISLLVWVNEGDAYVMRWPIPGFKPRTSIPLEWAKRNRWTGEPDPPYLETRLPIRKPKRRA